MAASEVELLATGKTEAQASQKGETPGYLEYDAPSYFASDSMAPAWLQGAMTDVFLFVSVHYNFWGVPCLALLWTLYRFGYGLLCVALVALYLPSFTNGAHQTAAGREWDLVRLSSMWNFTAHYLGAKVIREQELDKKKKYVFACHPHGIIVLSRVTTYGGNWEKLFPNLVARGKCILCASTMFYIPLAREFCLWLGCVDASRSTAKKVMDAGHSVFIYPGGVPEIFQLDPYSKENTIVLKKRMGFVKLAIRQGAELVPSFVFGEKWLFDRWNPPKRVIDFFQKTLKIPMIVFWGKFLWMPKQPPKGKKFGVVYGKPIATMQNATPTDAEVHTIHAQFVAEIQRIFAQYKAEFGYDEGETLVVN